MAKKPKLVTARVSSYDPWITVKKVLFQALLVAVIAILTYFIDTGLPQIMLEYPEYAAIIAVASALIVALLNYLKHMNDTQLVKMDPETEEIVEVLKE